MSKFLVNLTPAALLLLTVAGGAHAVDAPAAPAVDQGHGRITFTGDIIDAPCSIDSASLDQTVKLGSISKKQLASGGQSTPVPISIQLLGCNLETAKGAKITFSGTAGDAASGLDGGFSTAGQAKGVGVMITDMGGSVIKPAMATPVALNNGNNELQFQAYVQGSSVKDAVTAGSFTSVTNFMLTYQ